MNWKVKAHSLAILSRVPGGRHLYRTLQMLLRTDRTPVEEYVRRALEIVQMVKDAGNDPAKGTYLEIGTGWKPYLPFLLSLIGAERVITMDVNPWLTPGSATETFAALGAWLRLIASETGTELDVVERRYRDAAAHAADLPALLRHLRVDYRYPGDARSTGLAEQTVDVVCSSNVLEHLPPDVIREMQREAQRILRPGGLSVHRFNPEDHYCSVDRSITAVNFLQYSERQWRWYGGTGLAYHNRLRCCQYEKLFQEAGFEIRSRRVRIDHRALDLLRRGALQVHADYRGFTPEQLAADYMWLVAART